MDRKNREFKWLMDLAGWTAAETARRMRLTPAAISKIVNGENQPSGPALDHLKLLVVAENPDVFQFKEEQAMDQLEPWALDVIKDLQHLGPKERETLLANIQGMLKLITPAGDPAEGVERRIRNRIEEVRQDAKKRFSQAADSNHHHGKPRSEPGK